MNIEEAGPQRIEIALEQFRAGHAISYKGTHLQLQRSGALEVSSYSDFADPSYVSAEMAMSAISTSKSTLANLLLEQPELSFLVEGKPIVYSHLCSYGMGAIAVAEERAGLFNWLLQNKG